MRRRVEFTIDIYAEKGADATEVQRHLAWVLGGRQGVDLVNTRVTNDFRPPVDPETGEVLENHQPQEATD